MARKAKADVGALPDTGPGFWSKSIEEKKGVLDSLAPSQHSTFFNRLGAGVRRARDKGDGSHVEMADHVEQLRGHQKSTAARSLGNLFSPVSPRPDGPPAVAGSEGPTSAQEPRIDDEPPPRTGIQGALASGQPVGVHFRTGGTTDRATMRVVSPSNLQNFLATSIPKNASTVHVTHRKAGAAEPAHTTTLTKNQNGAWEETGREVHPPQTITPAAPYVRFTREEQEYRNRAEQSATAEVRTATDALEAPRQPAGLGLFSATERTPGGRGQSVAEGVHRVLMKNDPEYRAKFSADAAKFTSQMGDIAKAGRGLAESVIRTKKIKVGDPSSTVVGANVPPPASLPEELAKVGGYHVESSGEAAVGGPSENTPVSQQGAVHARPMDKQDHAIHDVIGLAHAVQHGSSQHLLASSPDLPEFDAKQIPALGNGVDTEDQRTAALNQGVSHAKTATHAAGLLGDVTGTSDHPPEINGYRVHHYVSRVAAEAGVDTDEGRMSAIADNARRLQRERQQGFVMGEGVGTSARTHVAQTRASDGPLGETRQRSHASRDLPIDEHGQGAEHERFYREGLHRTVGAALAAFNVHLANGGKPTAATSGESAYESAKARMAQRNNVPKAPPSVERGERDEDGYVDVTGQERRNKQQSEGIKGVRAKVGEDRELDEMSSAYLEAPPKAGLEAEAKAQAARATPTPGVAPSAETAEKPGTEIPPPGTHRRGRRAA